MEPSTGPVLGEKMTFSVEPLGRETVCRAVFHPGRESFRCLPLLRCEGEHVVPTLERSEAVPGSQLAPPEGIGSSGRRLEQLLDLRFEQRSAPLCRLASGAVGSVFLRDVSIRPVAGSDQGTRLWEEIVRIVLEHDLQRRLAYNSSNQLTITPISRGRSLVRRTLLFGIRICIRILFEWHPTNTLWRLIGSRWGRPSSDNLPVSEVSEPSGQGPNGISLCTA